MYLKLLEYSYIFRNGLNLTLPDLSAPFPMGIYELLWWYNITRMTLFLKVQDKLKLGNLDSRLLGKLKPIRFVNFSVASIMPNGWTLNFKKWSRLLSSFCMCVKFFSKGLVCPPPPVPIPCFCAANLGPLDSFSSASGTGAAAYWDPDRTASSGWLYPLHSRKH